ncbi:MAG: NYN domain-containing protein [Candidatus Omnitrophica bacterium]|nr:NYN domain-containing protein [Candidatus Omnitrophota bacterium]MBU4488801.1 NYN domain-containing protein [Candidatus Omnitrophota bacterium]MCG2705458.1 NYN domain-containing protein [Candidatus Omnitrophota bacterium]
MVDTLIVDGYNIIHALPELESELEKSLMSSRRALTEALKRYQAGERSIKRIYVVYDSKEGTGDIEDLGLVKNLYAPKGSSADSEIVRILKSAKSLKKTAVFSKDNFVINHARSMGADILPVDKFLRKIRSAKNTAKCHVLSEEAKEEINRELRKVWRIK